MRVDLHCTSSVHESSSTPTFILGLAARHRIVLPASLGLGVYISDDVDVSPVLEAV